ncbi:MAG: DUF421 domain-containing protein [Actinomycetota bacterium]|nr:DUF421 domain-containing protein [Actinomycetota bacterium]
MVILGFDVVAAFTPDVSLFEMVGRGVIVYLAIFVLLRYGLRNRLGTMTTSDLLVLVLIADAAQNAMGAEYHSIIDGIVLVATIIGMSFLFDWLAYHVSWITPFVHPDRKPLVVEGRIIRRTLHEELMTEGELLTQIHLAGAEDIEDVKAAYLEGNGAVSVIRRPETAAA